MNKSIKLLLESLFDDDFDELYNDNALDTVSQQITNSMKITSLSQCEDQEDVDEYFINKYDLSNLVINTITDVMKEIRRCTDIYDTFQPSSVKAQNLSNESRKILFSSDTVYNTTTKNYEAEFSFKCIIHTNNNKLVEFAIKQEPYSIIYRNNEKIIKSWAIIFNDKKEEHKIIWQLINYPSKPIAHGLLTNPPINKLINKINQELFSNVNNKINEIDIALKKQIENTFKTKRLADELTCTGKVYKVTLKDIDRMDKCLMTDQYTGFDKITKSDKMVARLAALFICANNKGYKNAQLSFNDDLLIYIIINKAFDINENTRSISRLHKTLQKLQLFPNIHLKDVIATYNAYKDLF